MRRRASQIRDDPVPERAHNKPMRELRLRRLPITAANARRYITVHCQRPRRAQVWGKIVSALDNPHMARPRQPQTERLSDVRDFASA